MLVERNQAPELPGRQGAIEKGAGGTVAGEALVGRERRCGLRIQPLRQQASLRLG